MANPFELNKVRSVEMECRLYLVGRLMENDGFFILDRWGYIQVGVREGCWGLGRGGCECLRRTQCV